MIELEASRPPGRFGRTLYAYWVLLRVLLSYGWVRVLSHFRSRAGTATLLKRKHRLNAQRIHKAITKLQGLFIKVGQLISILTNFLPEEFRSELSGLQDQVPPHPYEDIQRRLRDEFGPEAPQGLFASFDKKPIAAASIGQVHRATLQSGEEVAVKVQYPEIEDLMKADLRILRRVFDILERWMPGQGLVEVYLEIRSMVVAELDFKREAQNIQTIAENFQSRPGVAFPEVVETRSTERVLTTTFQEGIKSSDLEALDDTGIPRKQFAEQIIYAYCEQIFNDGIYHADPHPGNLLARLKQGEDDSPNEEVEVVFLDFGAVAKVSETMRQGIADLVQGGIAHDTQRVLRALRSMGFIAKTADPDIYERIVDFFHQRFHEEIRVESFSFKDIQIDPRKGLENLADLKRMDISLRDFTRQFHVPKEWILLERTFLLLMGLCTELAPDLNPMRVIQPYLESFVLGDRDPTAFVMDAAKELTLSAVALPGEIRRTLNLLQQGGVEVHFANLETNVTSLYRLGHQVIYTLLAIASGVGALALHDRSYDTGALGGASVSGVFLLFLFGSMWRERKRRRHRQRNKFP